jgi:hypothetical protein
LVAATLWIAVLIFGACGEDAESETLTSSRLASLLGVAGERGAGDYTYLVELEMTPSGTSIVTFDDTQSPPAEELFFQPGSSKPQTRTVTVVGIPVTFPLFRVDAQAIDKLVSGIEELSGGKPTITSLLLRQDGRKGPPEWLIRYNTGGETDLTYIADVDGTNIREAGE